MSSLKHVLLEQGFKRVEKDGLCLKIFPGYKVEFRPEEEGTWEDSHEYYMYFYSEKFGRFMPKLFSNDESIANSYKKRKLRKDTTGCLSMVSMSLDGEGFKSGGDTFPRDGLVAEVCAITDPFMAYEKFYKSKLSSFLILVEGVWVYLFLCKEMNLDTETILKNLSSSPELAEAWNLKKPLDGEIVSHFCAVYDSLGGEL